jgi:type IV pilus assembly protein PilV
MRVRAPIDGPNARSATSQRGSFLLEALISVLIVAFGVLGSIGLIARSMQTIDDAKYRGEAAFLASSLVAQMWIANKATLSAEFDSTAGSGAAYKEFKAVVEQRLPNAASLAQDVFVSAGPTPTSTNVVITIRWQSPGDDPSVVRQYQSAATIGSN